MAANGPNSSRIKTPTRVLLEHNHSFCAFTPTSGSLLQNLHSDLGQKRRQSQQEEGDGRSYVRCYRTAQSGTQLTRINNRVVGLLFVHVFYSFFQFPTFSFSPFSPFSGSDGCWLADLLSQEFFFPPAFSLFCPSLCQLLTHTHTRVLFPSRWICPVSGNLPIVTWMSVFDNYMPVYLLACSFWSYGALCSAPAVHWYQ